MCYASYDAKLMMRDAADRVKDLSVNLAPDAQSGRLRPGPLSALLARLKGLGAALHRLGTEPAK